MTTETVQVAYLSPLLAVITVLPASTAVGNSASDEPYGVVNAGKDEVLKNVDKWFTNVSHSGLRGYRPKLSLSVDSLPLPCFPPRRE